MLARYCHSEFARSIFAVAVLFLSLIVIALLAIGIVAWTGFDAKAAVRPAGKTFDEWIAQFGNPEQLSVCTANGNEMLFLSGSGRKRMPSGPPMYVFNKKGELVDWSADIGDDPGFLERWPGPSGEGVTLEEARKWLKKN